MFVSDLSSIVSSEALVFAIEGETFLMLIRNVVDRSRSRELVLLLELLLTRLSPAVEHFLALMSH